MGSRHGELPVADMPASYFEFLVEEPSMEAFLNAWMPSMLPKNSYQIYTYAGKSALLRKLGDRLKGYASWMSPEHRIVVIVDRDREDCVALKACLEDICKNAGLQSRSVVGGADWQVLTRIAIEELEAWYFGGWPAVCKAYPRVSPTIPNRASFRNPDAIAGGTSEAFERELKKHGYFKQGLVKKEAANAIGRHFDWNSSRSQSFVMFRDAILEAAFE